MRFLLPAVLAALCLATASAEWRPEYAIQPIEVQQWYATRELTAETRQRLGVQWKSCCNNSDVVKTSFQVDRKSGGDEWFWLDQATNAWRRVPPDTIHWGESAPSGQPTLFAVHGTETCFFPGRSGI